jgi:coenzyme PQQ synthesis protein D (PqqD)
LPLRRKPDLAWQTVGEEGIVVDLQGREVLGLNPVGALVWSLLPGHDEDAMVGEVVRRFDTDADTARRDVRAFVAELRRRGLLTEA